MRSNDGEDFMLHCFASVLTKRQPHCFMPGIAQGMLLQNSFIY